MTNTDKALYDKYSKNLAASTNNSSSSTPNSSPAKPVSSSSESTLYGTMTAKKFAADMQKLKDKGELKKNHQYVYTNEKGETKTFEWDGAQFKKIISKKAKENSGPKGVTGVTGATGIAGPGS